MPVTAFCCRRHYRERDHNYEILEELRRQRDNLSSSILIPYKVLITNYKILTIEKSSFNQLLATIHCKNNIFKRVQAAAWFNQLIEFQSQLMSSNLLAVIYIFLSNKRLNFETPSSWVFQSEFLKKLFLSRDKTTLHLYKSKKTQKSKFPKNLLS